MRSRKKWPWIVLGFIAGCPVLLAGVALVGLKLAFARSANTLPHELSLAKQAGMTTEPQELADMLKIPLSDNAAPNYRAAFKSLEESNAKRKPSDAISNFLVRGPSAPGEEQEVRERVSSAESAIASFEKGAAKPGLDWMRRWDQGPNILFPEFSPMKDGAKLLCAKAILNAEAGRTDEALKLIASAQRMGYHAGLDPTLIAALIQVTIDDIATSAMCRVLQLDHRRATLIKARELVRNYPPLCNLSRAFAGEMVLVRLGVQHMANQSGDSDSDMNQLREFPVSWLIKDANFRKSMEAKLVHTDTLAYEAVKNNSTRKDAMAALRKISAVVDADQTLESKVLPNVVFLNAPDATTRCTAYRHILATAIEILLERDRTGQLPSKVPSLGENSFDPYSEKPLGYRVVKGGGFKLYSVDSDLVDDGGLTRVEDRKGMSRTHDIAQTFK